MTDRSYAETRRDLRLVAAHVLARAQYAATGRIGLRATPGGFGTVEFGEPGARVRVSGAFLIREVSGAASTTAAMALDGSSLAQLAGFAGVVLTDDFSVGHDTPALDDVERPLTIDVGATRMLAGWYATTAQALDRVVGGLPLAEGLTATDGDASPTLAQLWPEHFDLALDVAFDAAAPGERRVNLGGSPGDGYHDEPYLYVGPWTTDRPGEERFWNAPFGAVLGRSAIGDGDAVTSAVAFFGEGLARLGGQASSR